MNDDGPTELDEIVAWEMHSFVNIRSGIKALRPVAEVDGTDNLPDRARIMLRRYLCEFRDNYVHKVSAFSSYEN